nr:GGDEF domain-containing protein [Paenibacillus phyllosphaerae]
MQREIEVLSSLRRAIDTEQELRIEKTIIDKLSKTDALTGLYNHRTFQEYLDHLVDQATRYPLPIQLAIIDIDHFKSINDSYGHSIGDIILRRVAELIHDAVTVNDIVARYGGEEFAIIFTGKSLEETYQMVEDMRLAISQVQHPEMNGRVATISAGLQDYSPGLSKSELFAQADKLLYEAKREGRNRTAMQA